VGVAKEDSAPGQAGQEGPRLWHPVGQAGWGECSGRSKWRAASLPRKMEDVLKEEMDSNTSVMFIHVCLCRVALL
jgi:hypothetical protein